MNIEPIHARLIGGAAHGLNLLVDPNIQCINHEVPHDPTWVAPPELAGLEAEPAGHQIVPYGRRAELDIYYAPHGRPAIYATSDVRSYNVQYTVAHLELLKHARLAIQRRCKISWTACPELAPIDGRGIWVRTEDRVTGDTKLRFSWLIDTTGQSPTNHPHWLQELHS